MTTLKGQRINLPCLLALFAIAALAALIPGTARCAPFEAQAVITDVKGIVLEAQGLRFQYYAGGSWIGTTPGRTYFGIHLEVVDTKDYVTTKMPLEFPFKEIKKIEVGEGGFHKLLTIEKRNGETVEIKSGKITIYDKDKKVLKQYSGAKFTGGKIQGQSLYPNAFTGTAKSPDGRVGDLRIPTSKVKTIEFK